MTGTRFFLLRCLFCYFVCLLLCLFVVLYELNFIIYEYIYMKIYIYEKLFFDKIFFHSFTILKVMCLRLHVTFNDLLITYSDNASFLD